MDYVFKNLKKIKTGLKGRFLFLFLDYDGTLAPIAATPDQAIVPLQARRLLRSLSGKKNCRVAIISGRALSDVKKKFSLKNIIYSGNHGFQIEGPGLRHEFAVPSGYKELLQCIKFGLKKELFGIKGVLIEDKKFSLSLHFRLVDKRQVPFIKNIFHKITGTYVVKDLIRVRSGKKSFEVRPPVLWDKGKVVLWLLARQEALLKAKTVTPVYIGDDATDEDAFRALKDNGLTIYVGKPKESQARYYLKDSKEVQVLLEEILYLP